MNKKTETALNGSIRKWERIVTSPRSFDKGTDNCPLCHSFLNFDCEGCPVQEKTGAYGCVGSPYIEWAEHHGKIHYSGMSLHRYTGCVKCLELAKAELAFLRSLLPKKRAKKETP